MGAEFKREIMLEELRKAMDRNAGYCKKGTRGYKEEPRKIRELTCLDKS